MSGDVLTLALKAPRRDRLGNQRRLADALRFGEWFRNTTGSLRGEPGSAWTPSAPYVAPGLRASGSWLRGDLADEAANARYVVYSYDTPIAWQNRDRTWTVPDVRYSRTTTAHQHAIRVALDAAGEAWDDGSDE